MAPPWAHEFDAWVAEALLRRDLDALLDYRWRAPAVSRALPTQEHVAPLCVALACRCEFDRLVVPDHRLRCGRDEQALGSVRLIYILFRAATFPVATRPFSPICGIRPDPVFLPMELFHS
ncbi:hypothetical protein PO883_22395 [Massilia sp. DJPM01]|uniref:hypothetical protein n=1 Tax=Massilia sp. DJPM01 TaxID=3024404 RepID=UPI00259DB26D|nr:hypothetical protein [Massilia sp. DJPM01]MDM5179946.1 hypothetical protein [Massilia sp. DJPM01]